MHFTIAVDRRVCSLFSSALIIHIVQERVNVGIAGTTANGYFFGIGFCTPQLLFSRIKSKFDAMKVFTTVIFAAKKLGAQLLFPHEKVGAKPQLIFSWGK